MLKNCPVDIIQGGAISFIIRLINQAAQGDPYDLTSVTALTTCFKNLDGTELMLSLGSGITILGAVIGKIQVSLTAAQTALLMPGTLETLELAITTTGDPVKIQIPESYNILQSVC